MKRVQLTLALALSTCAIGQLRGEELTPSYDYARVWKLIKPAADEGLWRLTPWETSLNAARRKAAAGGKPLLIWAGGGSAPLGGC